MSDFVTEAENKAWLEYDSSLESEQPEDFDQTKRAKAGATFHGENGWTLVGHGKVTNPEEGKKQCGKYYGNIGCLHVENHKGVVSFDGNGNMHDHTGQIYAHKRFRWCNNLRCPTCFRFGATKREAAAIAEKIKEAERCFHEKAEHIILSVPPKDYGLSFEELKEKARGVCYARNIHGAAMIFHAFRYHSANESYEGEPPHWYWSPHFHLLGFIRNGYAQCRNCDNMRKDGYLKNQERCLRCNGFEGIARRCHYGTANREGDGWIVKVKGERKSIFWTAWYQLEHASIRDDGSRFHVVSWFGSLSYHKLKYQKLARENLYYCPVCSEELKPVAFVGKAGTNPLDIIGVKFAWDYYLDERGVPRWVLRDGG